MATLKERSWLDIPEPIPVGNGKYVEYEDLSEEEKKERDLVNKELDRFIEEYKERQKKKQQDKN